MGHQEKKKQVGDLEKGEKFFYESAIFKMEWNHIATVIKSFNPEFKIGKTVKFNKTAVVEIVNE